MKNMYNQIPDCPNAECWTIYKESNSHDTVMTEIQKGFSPHSLSRKIDHHYREKTSNQFSPGDSSLLFQERATSILYPSGQINNKYLLFVSSLIPFWGRILLIPFFYSISKNKNKDKLSICISPLDTIGNCQKLAFTVGVSQHIHKITSLWKFELNRSSKLRENNERKKHFQMLDFETSILNLRSRNQIR